MLNASLLVGSRAPNYPGLALPAQVQAGPRLSSPHCTSLLKKAKGSGRKRGGLNNDQTYIQYIQLTLLVLDVQQPEVSEGTRRKFFHPAPETLWHRGVPTTPRVADEGYRTTMPYRAPLPREPLRSGVACCSNETCSSGINLRCPT